MKNTALGQLKENVKESQLLKVTTKFLIMAFIDELKEKEKQDLIDAKQEGYADGYQDATNDILSSI